MKSVRSMTLAAGAALALVACTPAPVEKAKAPAATSVQTTALIPPTVV